MASPDPYIDPSTGVLRNKVGATDEGTLAKAEGALTYARAAELLERPPTPTGDLAELRAIHRQLFQDVYDWAGELRRIDMNKKLSDTERTEFFMPAVAVERGMHMAALELHSDNYLQGMSRDQFIERLSHHYDQVNYAHPFREGNGRAQRMFWDRVSRDAGYELDWQQVTGEVNDKASRAAMEQRDFSQLHSMFDRITRPTQEQQPTEEQWRTAQLHRLAFPHPARPTQAPSGNTTSAQAQRPQQVHRQHPRGRE